MIIKKREVIDLFILCVSLLRPTLEISGVKTYGEILSSKQICFFFQSTGYTGNK